MPYVSEVAMQCLRQCHNTRPCRHAFLRESTTTPGWGHTHAGVQTLPEVNHGPGIEFRHFQRSCRPHRESHHDGAPQHCPTNAKTSGGTLCVPHPFVCSWPTPQCHADARNIDLAIMRHTRQPDATPPWHRNRMPWRRAGGPPRHPTLVPAGDNTSYDRTTTTPGRGNTQARATTLPEAQLGPGIEHSMQVGMYHPDTC